MTGCFMVMALDEDGLSKGGIRGYIDTTLVGENPFSILPVKQARAESRGNGSTHRLECLEDKEIGGRGGLDMMREGSINEVDEE